MGQALLSLGIIELRKKDTLIHSINGLIDVLPEDEEEYGCEYCRNDGELTENSRCPQCDAEHPEDPYDYYGPA